VNETWIVVLIVAIVALIVIGLIVALTRGRTGARLRPLPDESRDRFATSWKAVESKFIEDPAAAIREADRIAVMILSERGATLDDGRSVPEDMTKARAEAASDNGRQGTEGMRRAMVHYKRIVDDAVGPTRLRREDEYRREVAS
jgi:hypothetical protein